MMTKSQPHHGPGRGIINSGQRIISALVGIAETRVRLAVLELEEEKANLIQIALMAGLALLFSAFSLMSLIVLIIWSVNPHYRLIAIAITTAVLFVLALIFGCWTLAKSRRSSLLQATRKELYNDRKLLESE